MAFNYPKIDVDTIMAIRSLLKNPAYIDSAPYEPIVIETLKKLATRGSESKLSIEDIDYEQETLNLYNSINNINNLENIDAKERISVIKLKAQIIQDLLDMMKESKRIKEIHHFEDVIFSILTDEQKEQLERM